MGPDEILLRGSSLRNTEWVYGVCIFTGHETKIMKNGTHAKVKKSKIERATNQYIIVIMGIQVIVCLFGAAWATIWQNNQGQKYWYLDFNANDDNLVIQVLEAFGIWFVAMMNLVPISLLVTLEMVKVFQAYFISNDAMIFDEPRGIETKVQSSNLNEELGMVHYIFSDKTGTLTQNVMEFKRFSAGEYSYGTDNPDHFKEYAPGVTNVNFSDPLFEEHIRDESHPNHQQLKRFLEALGICHTVITEQKVSKEGAAYVSYNASSPDELALVNGARHLGFGFRERDADENMIIDTWDGERKYKLLNVIEFDSARKRMTVIVKTPEDKILVICKGADSIIEKRLVPGQRLLVKTNQYLEAYAKQGLRTLLIAEKEIDEQTYLDWAHKY